MSALIFAKRILLARYREWSTAAFYSLILLVVVFTMVIGIFPEGRTLIMKKFHLRGLSYPQWAILQFFPSMYHFSNELWISRHPLTEGTIRDPQALPADTLHVWVNHFPLHFVYFSLTHRALFYQHGYRYVVLRSVYRGQQLVSVYHIVISGDQLIFQQEGESF
jgi:hypothetical protein